MSDKTTKNNTFPSGKLIRDTIPENYWIPDNDRNPENYWIPENSRIPENARIPEKSRIPNGDVIPMSDRITREFSTPSEEEIQKMKETISPDNINRMLYCGTIQLLLSVIEDLLKENKSREEILKQIAIDSNQDKKMIQIVELILILLDGLC